MSVAFLFSFLISVESLQDETFPTIMASDWLRVTVIPHPKAPLILFVNVFACLNSFLFLSSLHHKFTVKKDDSANFVKIEAQNTCLHSSVCKYGDRDKNKIKL